MRSDKKPRKKRGELRREQDDELRQLWFARGRKKGEEEALSDLKKLLGISELENDVSRLEDSVDSLERDR